MHLIAWLRRASRAAQLVGDRPPGRAWRACAIRGPSSSTDAVLEALEALVPLAPLHQPHNLEPIRIMRRRMPELPQVACFDTAFHRSQPEIAQLFALPREMTRARACGATASTACPMPTSPRCLRDYDPAPRRRAGRGRPSRQRRQPVRARGRRERRDHDGLLRPRRPADGHALRRHRSRRRLLHAAGDEAQAPTRRSAALHEVRAARRLRPVERHADAALEARRANAGCQAGDRPVRLPHRAGDRIARRRARRHRRARLHRRASARTTRRRAPRSSPACRMGRVRARRGRERGRRAADLAPAPGPRPGSSRRTRN